MHGVKEANIRTPFQKDRQLDRQAGRHASVDESTSVTTWKVTTGAVSLLGPSGRLPSLQGDGERGLDGERARPSAESYTTAAARTR